jgi:hypothetical protein
MWDQKERPWKGIFIITDLTDRQLLFCSTTVTIGDGKCTLFWEARWLNGTSPKEITPNLYTRLISALRHAALNNKPFHVWSGIWALFRKHSFVLVGLLIFSGTI